MIKVFEKLCDGVVKEWGMIVALVLLAMPPMLFHPVFFGGLHNGLVNGFNDEILRQLRYPVMDMSVLMLIVLIVVEFVHWVDKKWVRWFVYGLSIALATIRIWLWCVFKMRITPTALSLLLETNDRECSDFVRVYLLQWNGFVLLGIVLGLVSVCYVIDWIEKKYVLKGKSKSIVILLFLLCSVWGFFDMRWYAKLLMCNYSDDVQKWSYESGCNYCNYGMSNIHAIALAVVSNVCNYNDISCSVLMAREVSERRNEVHCHNDSLLVVFVLGESYIKSHCGLYEYHRNTTPLLSREAENGNLLVFQDVVSPYTKTTNVVKTVFFTNDYSEKWYRSVFFPQLFKTAGFKVDVWDSQRDDDVNPWFDFDSFHVLYNEDLSSLSYSKVSTSGYRYDGLLVNDYKKQSFDFDCNRLIIMHLAGQHFDASKAFPHNKENMVFAGSDEISECVAMYDNACVYNDRVVTEIINMVREKKSIVVYFSDHGEEVYDYRNSMGRRAAEPGKEKQFLKYQAEVPFMIWCSDKYKAAYPDIVKEIETSVGKPFVTDNVCQVLFHLAALKSPWYEEERDLLSDKYKCGKRIVDGMYDYDEVMRIK